jgi:hypothetical protein
LSGSTTTAVPPGASQAAQVSFVGLHAGVVPLHWPLVQQLPGTQVGPAPQQMSAALEHVAPAVTHALETQAWLVPSQIVDAP